MTIVQRIMNAINEMSVQDELSQNVGKLVQNKNYAEKLLGIVVRKIGAYTNEDGIIVVKDATKLQMLKKALVSERGRLVGGAGGDLVVSVKVEGSEDILPIEVKGLSISESIRLNESIQGVNFKKASGAQRAKGESYVVYSVSKNEILKADNGKAIASGLNRNNAKDIAALDDDYKVASASWAFDKGIK